MTEMYGALQEELYKQIYRKLMKVRKARGNRPTKEFVDWLFDNYDIMPGGNGEITAKVEIPDVNMGDWVERIIWGKK